MELRKRRQARLREPQFRLWAVIDEAAVRSRHVKAQTMRSQITHLINVAEEANITLRMLNISQVPELDGHVTVNEPVTHFRFPEEHVADVVFIERPPDGVILNDRKETAHYSRLMSRLGVRAARAGSVQDHLREIFVELLRRALTSSLPVLGSRSAPHPPCGRESFSAWRQHLPRRSPPRNP